MATSYLRGHKIKYNHDAGHWFFIDTGEPTVGESRPCGRCGEYATTDGHDACLANLPGIINACCGHGHGESYLMFEDGRSFKMTITERWDNNEEADEE